MHTGLPLISLDSGRGALWRGGLLALVLLFTGCETAPPVQEMSDARQAIAVAREAGAENHAADALREAEAYLDSAQRKLGERAYAQARRDALQAKNRALHALAVADQSQRDDDS